MKSLSISSLLFLIIAFFIYSIVGIFSKMASFQDFLTFWYCLYIVCIIILLTVYAIFWQMILNKIPLSQAYLYKSITIIFSLLFAYSIFGESITWKNFIGVMLIITGLFFNFRDKIIV